MIPIVASLLGTLAQNGLGFTVQRHPGQRQRGGGETRLGSRFLTHPTPEDVSKLRQLQFDHEERLLELGIEKAKLELAELESAG
jgi:hypothetical protein